MQGLRLESFDLGNLVKRLNISLADGDEVIELGKFEDKKSEINSFLYQLRGEKLEARGKFPLRQTVCDGGLLSSFYGLSSEVNLGYIFIKIWHTHADSSRGERIETLELQTEYPLELREGKEIPGCYIKFLPNQERKNYQRENRLFWKETDLKKVLPSEWFLGGKNVKDYELKTEGD